MTTIVIRLQQKTEAGFDATVSFEGRVGYPVQILNPFDDKQERRLAWYFERWINQPTTDTVIAAQVQQSLREYGDRLFAQVFRADRDAEHEYRQVRSQLSRVQIEIVGNDPTFQALHWETMRDPDLDRLLAIECVMLRRQDWRAAVAAKPMPSTTINVLLVTARPDEEKDLQYRVTSRPLLAAIENSQMPINLVLLRPGTYEALERHLAAVPEGFYHIVHFDAHGGVMNSELLQAYEKRDRVLLKGRYGGRADLQAFQGERAFLFLETDKKGAADPVETQELARLLNGKGIPICILDACQLAQNPVGAGEAAEEGLSDSLGSRLMTAGMQMVVAMRYSILAEAAGQLMGQFYQALVNRRSLLEAVRLGRRELFNQKSRRANYNQRVDLEDWLLPIVYCNQPQAMTIELLPMHPDEAAAYWQRQAGHYRFPEPTYGFVGRDLEILKIEKSLLRRNLLLVQGMGGTGKTTLLNYLRQWWQKTNFVARTFYFGYDQKAWTLAQILHDIGKAIYSTYEQVTFQAMPPEAQQQKLISTLRSGCPQTHLPYALILDNLESITGQALAIPNTLPPAEQQQIRDFLSRLVGGKIYVVLGSRSSEDWLKQATFRDNLYVLQGLDPDSRSQLAEKILQQQVGDRTAEIRQDPHFTQLIKLLAGYPLAMEVVLANLRRQNPSEILAALDAADVALDSGSTEKTESILKCVEYSHSNLSETAQRLLLSLAPFSGFIFLRGLPTYVERLQQFPLYQPYAIEAFDSAIQEAIHWGLLSPINEDNPELLTIQPIFPYFLKTRLNKLEENDRSVIQTAFKLHYQGIAEVYRQWMESKEPQQRQMGIWFCRWEYENLFQALRLCLARQESINIYFCLDRYFELISDRQSNLKLSEWVNQQLEQYSPEFLQNREGYQVAIAIARLGTCYLETQQYQPAQTAYERALSLYEQMDGIEETQKQQWRASAYQQLGIVAQAMREFEQARHYYQQSLNLNIEFNDRYSQASTYHQLGKVAQETEKFEQARHYYQNAIDIYIEFNDRHNQALTYHNLGIVFLLMQEYEQAQHYYQQSLNLKLEFNDRHNQALTYRDLGVIAQNLKDYERAWHCYQQALDIYIEFNARYEQSSVYHNLGTLSQELREYEQAQHYYRQSLNLEIEFNDRRNQAIVHDQMGNTALQMRQYEQAQQHYQQAIEIQIELGDRVGQASTYRHLSILALMMQEYEQVQQYCQQAITLYIELDKHYEQASIYDELGSVAEKIQDYRQSRQYYQQAMEAYIELGDRANQGVLHHQLGTVTLMMQEYEQAQQHYQQAINICVELNDRHNQASAYYQLGMIFQEMQEHEQARQHYQQAINICVEFNDRYNQARIYHRLGLLEEELNNLPAAQANLVQALQISAEYADQSSVSAVMRNLARFYHTYPSSDLLMAIAQVCGVTVKQAQVWLNSWKAELK